MTQISVIGHRAKRPIKTKLYVNAVTGEKSADILKEVELGATNDPFDESQNGGGGE